MVIGGCDVISYIMLNMNVGVVLGKDTDFHEWLCDLGKRGVGWNANVSNII